MPLGQNPAFGKILQAVDFIVQDNERIRAEKRQKQRQIEAENRQYQRQLDLARIQREEQQKILERQRAQQEYDELDKYLKQYESIINQGEVSLKPGETGLYNAARQRQQHLVSSGLVTPKFNVPERLFELSQAAQMVFGLSGADAFVPLDVKKELEMKVADMAYRRDYDKYKRKQDFDFRLELEKEKAKLTEGKNKKTREELALDEISRKRAKAEKYSQEGIKDEKDTEKLGILRDAVAYYIENLNKMQNKIYANQWTDSLHQVLLNTPDFEEYYKQTKDVGKSDEELEKINELLKNLEKIE